MEGQWGWVGGRGWGRCGDGDLIFVISGRGRARR